MFPACVGLLQSFDADDWVTGTAFGPYVTWCTFSHRFSYRNCEGRELSKKQRTVFAWKQTSKTTVVLADLQVHVTA